MNSCECGKVRYLTRKEARHHARTFRGSHDYGKLRAYQCDGGFWHLTSQSARRTTIWRAWERPGTGHQP